MKKKIKKKFRNNKNS